MRKFRFKGLSKGAGCCAAAVVLVISMCGTAFAAESYDIPTSEMDPNNYQGMNERVLTAIGAHGSAVVGEYVGLSEQINQTYATTGNGVSTENYMNNPYFGIYGTTANEAPDPYVSNLFYKWYLKASGKTEAAEAVQNYMYNYLFTGYAGSCITADATSVRNGTSYALSGRPDVIVTQTGNTHGFDEEIAKINNFKTEGSEYYIVGGDKYVGDENYKPVISEYTECLTKGFIQSVYNAADAAQAAYNYNWTGTSQQAKVQLRYGYDDAQETAQKYEKYTIGTDLYVLSKIADGTVNRKTVAYVTSIDGEGKNAVFTIQGNLDPTKSGESSGHILEPLNATCDNLANKLDPNLTIQAKPGATTTCTVDELATADVIILTKPDNMAYNGMGSDTYTGVKTGKTEYGAADQGENSSRHYGDISEGHFKNTFCGPQTVTNNKVTTIQNALADAGYTEQSQRNILSCLMENSSNCDGGSVDAMALHGVLQGFAYPEIMNSLEQYGWFLNNMSHIKTDQVNKMVSILARDLTLADDVSMADFDYTKNTSETLLAQYEEGLQYYQAHSAIIDELYPQLTPSDRLEMPDPVKDEGVSAYVTRLYENVLGRFADEAGKAVQIEGMKTSGAAQITFNFYNSDEFKAKSATMTNAEIVENVYQTMLNRSSDEAGLAMWTKYLDNGMSACALAAGFAESDEFASVCSIYGIGTGSADWLRANLLESRDKKPGVTSFVYRLYTIVLNRDAEVDGLNVQCQALIDGTACWDMATRFFNSQEYINFAKTDTEFVADCYKAMMDREGTEAEIEAWVARMDKEGLSRVDVVKGFCQSDEFEAICQSCGMTSGMR